VLLGAVFGVASYHALIPIVSAHVEVNGIRPFADDLELSVAAQALVVVGVLLVAVASGVLLGRTPTAPSIRPSREPRRFVPAPLVIVALGVVLGGGCAVSIADDPRSLTSVMLLDATAAALVVGSSLSLAFVLQRCGRQAARVFPSGGALLAARRLESDPGVMTRLGAVVLPAIFAIGFAATIATQFQLRDPTAGEEANFHGRQAGVVQAPDLPDAGLTAIGVKALAVLPHLRSTGPDVMVASCAQLRELSGRPNLRCPVGRFVLTVTNPVAGGPAQPQPLRPPGAHRGTTPLRAVIQTKSGGTVTIPAPDTTLRLQVPLPLMQISNAIVLPPNDPAVRSIGADASVWELTVTIPADDPAAADALRASVVRTNPLAEVDLAGADELAANAGYARYGTTAMLLALVACGVGAAGVAITALDAVMTQRRRLEPLLVFGAPRRVLRRAIAVEIIVPLALAVVTGASVALACSVLFTAGHSNARLAASTMTISAIAGLAVAILVAVVAATLVPRTPQRISARPD